MGHWSSSGSRPHTNLMVPVYSTTIFCLAPSAHGPAPFARWPPSIANVSFAALQFPGQWDAHWWMDHETFEAQAADLAADLHVSPAHRFGFFAHGSSVFVAYEAAAQLARMGKPTPCRMIFSACPPIHHAQPDIREQNYDELFARALRIFSELHMNPLPSLIEMSVQALRMEVMALRAYDAQGKQPLGIPITVIRWRRDAEAGDSTLIGWNRHDTVSYAEINGTHFSYSRAPNDLMQILSLT
jgi:surfactin synthase thioesterase subunit